MLHLIIFVTACAQNGILRHQRNRRMLTRLTNSMFNSVQPRAAHSLVMCHFSLSRMILKWIRLMLN